MMDNNFCPLSDFNLKNVISVLNMLKKKNKMSILNMTHDLNDVLHSDRVIVINNGSIVIDGSVKSVLKQKDKLLEYGLQVPLVVDLSLELIKNNRIINIYFDERKLVDFLWKLD